MRIKINGEKIIVLSLILLILYLCLPITISLLNSLAIRALVVLAALLFVLGLVLLNRWKNLFELFGLFFVTFLFWFVVWRHLSDSFSYIYYCFASLCFVFGGVVVYQSEDHAMCRRLFLFLTAVILVTSITTISGLRIYPFASREMARGSTYNPTLDFEVYKTIYRRLNIAGWGQIYGMLFFVPCFCMLWKRTKNPLLLIALLLIEAAIIASQITFAAILSLAFIFGILVIGNSSVKNILVIFLVLFAACLVLLNLESILTWAVNISDDMGFGFLKDKLNDLKQLLIYREVVGDASSRSDLYRNSLTSFLRSPVIGQLLNFNVTQDVIGRHSELFDMIGALGLIGVAGILYAVARYWAFLKKLDPAFRKELGIIFLGFLLLFVINPVLNSPPIFVGAFLYSLLSVKICRIGICGHRRLKIVFHTRRG